MYSTREISPDAMRKPPRNKGKHTEGQCTEILGSARERDWVVGLQILTVFHGGEIARKLAGNILNVLAISWVGIWLVLCPFPCNVFVMYQVGTPPLAPSGCRSTTCPPCYPNEPIMILFPVPEPVPSTPTTPSDPSTHQC